MAVIELLLPSRAVRLWHRRLYDRLQAAGHVVGVRVDDAVPGTEPMLERILAAERLFLRGRSGLSAIVPPFGEPAAQPPDLTIDLRGAGAASPAPVVTLTFDGAPGLTCAAATLAEGRSPVILLLRDGRSVGRAAPMASGRAFVLRGLDDVLARAITLLLHHVARLDEPPAEPVPSEQVPERGLLSAYLGAALPRLLARSLERLRYHGDHWRVGYRFVGGLGVAETGSLCGELWSVLPDDGRRFYADPFPFEHEGRHFIFVEELEHSLGKGVISVAEEQAPGRFSTPRPVLEEPFHLSYPQVFARDGAVWMIPEGGAGGAVVLYRADPFPERWVCHAVLVPGREIFDATLVEHGGKLWLVGTERDGAGDASDTMVVFHADALEGPWQPHRQNPILIDKAAARPGGAFVRQEDRILLPIQDGTERYGGGLGLSELLRLDEEAVAFAPPKPIETKGYWPYPRIHTLNRAGRLEVIDGLARVPRR